MNSPNNSGKDAESIILDIAALPPYSLQKILDIIYIENYPKGYILFHENKKDRDIYFIHHGIARVYYLHDITEVNLMFGIEGDSLISLKSYIEDKPGYETVELLEKSTLFRLKYQDLQQLYNEDIAIANWGRKIAEKELIKTEERLISRQFRTASQRYAELMEKSPYLLQRVQLGHIASYLGVSQVTLSRIRAEIR
ncbi:MAG TPA: Crp/Fnr family transcriptional regulator [Dysgonomonas sp.]|nr:Crp/Fnr family transcriptional regulator [Dysgonomonas sp.]